MAVLVWGIATGALAFLLHLCLWRIRAPRRELSAIAGIFGGCTAAAVMAQWLPAGAWEPIGVPHLGDWPEVVSFCLFVTAWTLAYMVTYTAMNVDSPSLVIMDRIAAAGPDGLPVEALAALVSNDRLVVPRVRDLARTGLAVVQDGRYVLAPKGRNVIALLGIYQRILGRTKGG